MKPYVKHLFLSLTLLVFMACDSNLDQINENPNDPSEISPALLLTYAEKHSFEMASSTGKNIKSPMYATRMIVSVSGENEFQYLKWNQGSFDSYKILSQINKMMEEAEKTNHKNYLAVGKFLRAFHFYNLTLSFGDIPYSQALKAESSELYFPEYDSQEQVFIGILNELKEANNIINNSDTLNGDIIFSGNTSKWKKLINSFRLRVLMTLSHKSKIGEININQEFAQIVQSEVLMSSNQDNGQLVFHDRLDNRYISFNDSDYGSSLFMSGTFVKILQERKDPRLFSFAAQTGKAEANGLSIRNFDAYNGGNPVGPYTDNLTLANEQNISKVNKRYYEDPTNEPHNILSYSEQEFILAEAAIRGWISTDAKTHYENAVKASFDFYQNSLKDANIYFENFNLNDYLQQDLVSFDKQTSFEDKLNLILTQKYISMFHQQGWTLYFDFIRTGFPKLPLPNSTTPPFRFLYPTSEYNTNAFNLEKALERQFSGHDNIKSIPWLNK